MFLHAPETHVSSPGPAPSPDAGGSPGQEEQHHVLAIYLQHATEGSTR